MNYKHLLWPLLAGTLWLNAAAQHQSTQSFQKSGLHFVENKGQIRDQHQNPRPDIDFKLQATNGLNLFIGSGQLHYQFARPIYEPTTKSSIERLMHPDEEEVVKEYALYRLDVELIGSNPNANIIREEPLSYYERYFLSWVNTANDNAGVLAQSFQKVTYQNVYPNIDWVFYFNAQGQLEHDFVVHPGGNISAIKMRYKGSAELDLKLDGSLQALTPMGKIIENAPYAYTQDGEQVVSAFVLEGDVLSFTTDDYSGTLIIDPVIEWGTYFGGTADEEAGDITTDTWGNVYLCGTTTSMSNIATTGAFQDTLAGRDDAFLSKWDIDGQLLWASYYGGDRDDAAKGVAVDTLGHVYLFGNAASASGISTPGSYQDAKLGTANRYDAFLVKFDSAGMRQWGTYYGGTFNEANSSGDIAIDPSNNLYITGNTQSSNLPVTAGCHQAIYGGDDDGFVAKFSENGDLIWSSYYGGENSDYPYALDVDHMEGLYITGYTQSSSGISTTGAFQTNNAGGQDVFLTKFDSTGQLIWGTYLGGTEIDRGYAVEATDSKIYIGGVSLSASNVATPNSHQPTFSGGSGGDGIIASFQHNGSLNWCTYYGGDQAETLEGIFINEGGEVYISGQTSSTGGISTSGSFQSTIGGSSDNYIAKFDALGQRLWGTYYGGSDTENHGKISGDWNGSIYLVGGTNSASGIATSNGFQSSFSGGLDAFMVRINDCEIPILPESIQGELEVCSGTEQVYTVAPDILATEYVWLLPVEWMGESDSSSISTLVSDAGGEIKVVAISDCGGVSDTQTISVTVLQSPEPELQEDDLILSTTRTYESYQWLFNGEDIAEATDPIYLAEEDGYYQVRVRNADSCFGLSDSLLVQGASGIDEVSTSIDVQLYPNPSSGQFFLESKTEGVIHCFNLEGKPIVESMHFEAGLSQFDLRYLPVAVYLIKVITDEGVKVVKWVRE